MVSIQKTASTSILAVQTVTSNTVVISSVQSLLTKLAATVFIHFGRAATTALTEGAELRVEASSQASGDGFWFPLASFKTKTVATNTGIAVTTQAPASQNVLPMTSTTGLAVGDLVFIQNVTIGNSEWHRIKAVAANTSITIEDNLANIQQTTAKVYNQAEFYAAQLDLTAVTRLRVVVNASNTGQTTAIECSIVTGDSIG